jgi:hypothetical protein
MKNPIAASTIGITSHFTRYQPTPPVRLAMRAL